jgi:NosR/NirI family nitrous oxide reductase transcriptional regulator
MLRQAGSALIALLVVLALAAGARAGSLSRDDLALVFPAPLVVGERDPDLPVWPVFHGGGQNQLAAWAFESADFATIPGFSGSPVNLLVALRPDGSYLDVRVLEQHEPVFVHGLGPAPLDAFVRQYVGKSIAQPIKIVSGWGGATHDAGSAAVQIDGVAKATASVRIVNESLLAAALEVARAKLGLGGGSASIARPRQGPVERLGWDELVARGWVAHRRLANREVEAAFADSPARRLDPEALDEPDAPFTDVWAAYLDVPSIGVSLLGEAGYASLRELLEPGDHALWVGSAGRWSIQAEDYVPGTVPDRLALRQGGLPIELRDVVFDLGPGPAGMPALDTTAILRVAGSAGFDPGSPRELDLRVTRAKGQVYPELFSRDFALRHVLPEALFERPTRSAEPTGWRAIWADRRLDIAILGTALVLLTTALLAQRRLTADARGFAAFRWAWLAFLLFWVGWWAQGQLSIVNLIGLVKAAAGDGSLAFTLYDPMTFLIGAFTLPTLVIWGRGTFCGWLCPFGALQEAAGWLAQRLCIRQLRVLPRLDRALRQLKYLILAVILAAAWLSADLAERLAEIEPFKTAITLAFVRSLLFVLYALALLAAGMFVFKAYCRYLCPLGAALAAMGALRRWNWIPRKAACGSPCRLCEVKCRYGAIERSGRVRYDECFQCLECVVIHNDPRACVPEVLARRRAPASFPAEAAP